ncbi:MAG: K(+)-transporting ATPase subunit F [Candidatus Nanopelagicales bacterium]
MTTAEAVIGIVVVLLLLGYLVLALVMPERF